MRMKATTMSNEDGKDHVVVIEVTSGAANVHHVVAADRLQAWRDGDGTSGQDRESYGDDQDRESYGADDDDIVEFVGEEGEGFATWSDAVAHVEQIGGRIVDVVAAVGD